MSLIIWSPQTLIPSIRQHKQRYLQSIQIRTYSRVSGRIQKHWGEGHFKQRAEPNHLSLIWVFSLHTGRLRNLQVANHTQLFENGSCEIQLTCSVENPNDNASIRWQVAGNTIREEANLTISWEPKNSSEKTYTCIAKNPVSNLSFSFSVQSLCKGNSLSQVSLKALSSSRVWRDHITDMIPQTAAQ